MRHQPSIKERFFTKITELKDVVKEHPKRTAAIVLSAIALIVFLAIIL